MHMHMHMPKRRRGCPFLSALLFPSYPNLPDCPPETTTAEIIQLFSSHLFNNRMYIQIIKLISKPRENHFREEGLDK